MERMPVKRALITGVAGQDGSYLAELLVQKKYQVVGVSRSGSDLARVPQEVRCIQGDLADPALIQAVVGEARPDEVYHLAGVTDLKTAFSDPAATMRINYESVGVLLDACVRANPHVRFLQASSSEVFLPSSQPLNECSPRDWGTNNPYAAAKMLADRDFVAEYRNKRAGFACSAYLFNHESPRRSEKSALRKITRTLAGIRCGMNASLVMGNIELSRDWGYAKEYVDAMWRMLQIDSPNDLVIASGVLSRVRDAIDIAAKALEIDLDWRGEGADAVALDGSGRLLVTISPELYKPAETWPKVGDIGEAKRLIGWRPTTDFKSLVEMMAREDYRDARKRQNEGTLRPG
jgi:GDPmannose 4,6-dehydratase